MNEGSLKELNSTSVQKKGGGVILLTQTFNQVIKSILNIEITTDNTVNLENSVLSRD